MSLGEKGVWKWDLIKVFEYVSIFVKKKRWTLNTLSHGEQSDDLLTK